MRTRKSVGSVRWVCETARTHQADAVGPVAHAGAPEYVAVNDAAPVAAGVHEHVATELETATPTQPVMLVPPAANVTVPVAVAVTFAVIVAA